MGNSIYLGFKTYSRVNFYIGNSIYLGFKTYSYTVELNSQHLNNIHTMLANTPFNSTHSNNVHTTSKLTHDP